MTKKTTKGARPRRPASARAIEKALKRPASAEVERARAELRANIKDALAYTHVQSKEIARRMGVQPAATSKLLACKQGLSLENLAKLAHALGMSLHVSLRTPAALVPMPTSVDQHAKQ